MKNRLAQFLTVMLLSNVLWGCASTSTSTTEVTPRDGVLVHIKSGLDQPHSVVMGLRMAQMMAQDKDVLVYLDVEGIKVALKESPELKVEPMGSSRVLLQDLLDKKVTVLACPGCMKVMGKKSEDLLPGVVVASKEPFFSFTRGRILTLDY